MFKKMYFLNTFYFVLDHFKGKRLKVGACDIQYTAAEREEKHFPMLYQ